MITIKTKFSGLKLIQTELFKDQRGFFKEIFQNRIEKNNKFVFDCMSYSKKNVLRGLHIQRKNSQAKLITVVHGAIYDVCVDLRKKSKTYGEKFSIKLSQNSNTSIIIPAGFAHGFLCLTKNCVLYYKSSKYRDKNSEVSILWNDPDLKINWPVKKPILSEKDQKGILLKNF
jgi:dTDP-4-dehydrorhamnose 3,5-epimerase|tara:strand:+ start:2008 stop:2523 length:516 start_codon:yes stop_codon:yes gene_type:complete